MKKNIFLLLIICHFNSYCQNLFFIGEKSYPATETFLLMNNSNLSPNNMLGLNYLNVLIAKTSNNSGFLVLSKKTMTNVLIRGKILIYLDDGSVITCIDKGKYDLVDGISSTIFSLTLQELEKLKKSNINTIRYSLKCGADCITSSEEGNFTASNKTGYDKNIDIPSLINKLFE